TEEHVGDQRAGIRNQSQEQRDGEERKIQFLVRPCITDCFADREKEGVTLCIEDKRQDQKRDEPGGDHHHKRHRPCLGVELRGGLLVLILVQDKAQAVKRLLDVRQVDLHMGSVHIVPQRCILIIEEDFLAGDVFVAEGKVRVRYFALL